jgi:hypothetical protein
VATSATLTLSVTVSPQTTTEESRTYHSELKEWNTVNNIMAGVILGSISDEVQYIINPREVAKDMYDKLKAEIVRQSSGSSANSSRIELIYKNFKDTMTMEIFEKHLMFYQLKNSILIAASAGFDDAFLTWILLNSFSLDNMIWSMASINIITSDIPINQWSFNVVAGKLCEALRNSICPTEASTSGSNGSNQSALNASASRTNANCYAGPLCTYSGCHKPKTHPTEKCWAKEKEEKEKEKEKEMEKEKEKSKKHKVKKVKKKAMESSSDLESGLDSSDSDTEHTKKKCHHANHSQVKMLHVLKATVKQVCSYKGQTATNNIFIMHLDSGALNHMTHK